MIAGWVALGVSLGAAAALCLLWRKVSRYAVTVDTMWDFQIRRSAAELVFRGVGTVNSPVTVSAEAKSWLKGLATELRTFYRRLGRTLTERDLLLEIERRYGARILREVCIPHGLFEGACLLIAAAVACEPQ